MWFYLKEAPKSSQIPREKKVKWWLPGAGEGRIGSYYLVGTELQFCKMKKVWTLVVQQYQYT